MIRFLLFLMLCIVAAGSLLGQKKRELVWSDEFNYMGLPDATKWAYDTGGHGWGNRELQYYTQLRKENARVNKGRLIIEARKEDWKGMAYTSTRLITRNRFEFLYGRVEVRARIPEGRGTWPAIWMLGAKKPLSWPDDGEIDIMEHVGFNPGMVHASIHCRAYFHSIGTQKTDTIHVPDFSKKFHVYAVDWTKDSIQVSVDNRVYFTFVNEHKDQTTWPFNNPMYLLLNVAVGGNWGGEKGVDQAIWPRRMEVDYVRIYR